MLTLLSKKVSYFLLKNSEVSEEKMALIQYGLHYIFSIMVFLGYLMIVGFAFSQEIQVLGLFVGFTALRNTLGGFHAKTEMQCTIATFVIFSLDLLLIHGMVSLGSAVFVVLIPLLVIMVILVKPMDHPNRRFKETESKQFRNKSLRNMGFLIILALLMNYFVGENAHTFTVALLTGAITAALAVVYSKEILKREKEREE